MAGGWVLAPAVLWSRCDWVHPSQSAASAVGDISVWADMWDLSQLPLWKTPSGGWKLWACRALLSRGWMIAGAVFFGLPGAGTSVWTVYRLPFPHLYLGEMSWWARRWSACCSHQEGWPVDGFLYVVHLPSARRDPVQAHAVSPLPLPSMGVWLPGHLQGQRDGFAASPGGLFGVEVPATPFFLPLRCLGSVPC